MPRVDQRDHQGPLDKPRLGEPALRRYSVASPVAQDAQKETGIRHRLPKVTTGVVHGLCSAPRGVPWLTATESCPDPPQAHCDPAPCTRPDDPGADRPNSPAVRRQLRAAPGNSRQSGDGSICNSAPRRIAMSFASARIVFTRRGRSPAAAWATTTRSRRSGHASTSASTCGPRRTHRARAARPPRARRQKEHPPHRRRARFRHGLGAGGPEAVNGDQERRRTASQEHRSGRRTVAGSRDRITARGAGLHSALPKGDRAPHQEPIRAAGSRVSPDRRSATTLRSPSGTGFPPARIPAVPPPPG